MTQSLTGQESDVEPCSEPRYLKTLVAVLALAFGLLAMRPVTSLDFWWHLSMGRAAVEAMAASFPEPVALSAAQTYSNFEWLFDVILFGLYGLGGVALVNLAVGALAAASFVFCWMVARVLCGRAAPFTALALACLAFGAAHARFVPRPQSCFLVFLPLALLLGLGLSRKFRLSAVALVVLFAIWAQVHASVVIAPAVVFAAMLIGASKPGEYRVWKLLDTRHVILLVILSALTLTTPRGIGILAIVIDSTDHEVIRHVNEMRPLRLSELSLSTTLVFLVCLVCVALWGIVLRRRVPVWPVLLVGLGLAMAASSVRFLAALAILTLPMAATVWTGRERRESGHWAIFSLLVVLAVPLGLAWRSGSPSLSIYEPVYPVGAAEALKHLGVSGPIFNTYGDGGYLGWQLYGKARIVIDGRTQALFNSEEFFATRTAEKDKNAFESLNNIHGFSAAVVSKDLGICLGLVDDSAWSTVWIGESDAIFMPSGTAPHRLNALSACRYEANSVGECRRSGDLDAFLADIEKILQISPEDAFVSRLGAELALQCLPRPNVEKALNFLQGAASLEPDHPEFAWQTAYLLLLRNEPEKALVVAEGLPLDHVRGQTLRLRVLMQLGRGKEAADLGQRLTIRYLDNASPEFRELVAAACESADDRSCAVRNSLRAATVGFEPAKDRLRRYLENGWVPDKYLALARGAVH